MDSFTPRDLLACYASGVFPMSDTRDDEDLYLVDPRRRGVIPLERFHVSRRLARTVRADAFEVRIDSAFEAVVEACAAPTQERAETWISRPIEGLYLALHQMGYGHSVECWRAGELAGGLYGVALQGAFFGESMFSRERDASKVALVHLVARLIAGGFRLLDTQFITEHLTQFGAEEIARSEYHRRLARALSVNADFYVLGSGASAGSGSGAGGGAMTGASGSGGGLGATAGGLGGGATAGAGAAATNGCAALQVITQAS
jgi:leucyl/phenylalanyl-tRNA--protein transferase